VAYYRVKKASLQSKEGYQSLSPAQLRELLRIDEEQIEGMSKYNEQSEELLQSSQSGSKQDVATQSSAMLPSTSAREVSFGRQDNWFSVSIESETQGDETIEDEVTRCFELLNRELSSLDFQRTLAKPPHQQSLCNRTAFLWPKYSTKISYWPTWEISQKQTRHIPPSSEAHRHLERVLLLFFHQINVYDLKQWDTMTRFCRSEAGLEEVRCTFRVSVIGLLRTLGRTRRRSW
jgi:hypothetical protein